MADQDVFRFAVKALEDSILNVCRQAGISVDQLDWIIPHQANTRIIEYVSKKMAIPINKFYLNIEQFGNTSAASVPIAYAQAIEQNKIQKGHKIVLVGFGGGLTYGACYVEV